MSLRLSQSPLRAKVLLLRGTVKLTCAGVGSTTPAAFTAATVTTCVPARNFSERPAGPHGTVSSSTVQTKVAGAVLEE